MIASMYVIAFAILALPFVWGPLFGFLKLALHYGFSALACTISSLIQIATTVFVGLGSFGLINSWIFVHGLHRAIGKIINLCLYAYIGWNLVCFALLPFTDPVDYVARPIPAPNITGLFDPPIITPTRDYSLEIITVFRLSLGLVVYWIFNNDLHTFANAHRAFLTHYYDQDLSRKLGRRKWRRMVRSSRNSIIEYYKTFGTRKLDYHFNFDDQLQAGPFYSTGAPGEESWTKGFGLPNASMNSITLFQILFTELADVPRHRAAFEHLPMRGFRDLFRKVRKFSIYYTGVSITLWVGCLMACAYRRTHNSDERLKNKEPETTLDALTRHIIRYCAFSASLNLSFGLTLEVLLIASGGASMFLQQQGFDPEKHGFAKRKFADPVDHAATEPEPELQAGSEPPIFGIKEALALFAKVDTIYLMRSTARAILVIGFVVAAFGTGVTPLEAINSAIDSPLFKKITNMKPTELFTDVVSLLNRIVEAVHTGRYSAIFCADPILAELTSKCNWFLASDVSELGAGLASPFSDKPVFNHEFIRFGETLVSDVKGIIALEKMKFGVTAAKSWMEMLTKIELKVKTVTQHNDSLGVHEAPYAVLIPGQSAVGKSFLWVIWRKVGCSIFNLPCDDTYTYVVNDTHKHWDGFSSAMHTLLWDDASCTKLKEGEPGFLGTWLNVAGNNTYTPAAADVGNKGHMRAAFKMVFATSNTIDLQTKTVMVAPEAAMRRFNVMIVPEVKLEYLNENGVIDGFDKFYQKHGRNPNHTAEYDFWNFKVYKSVLNGVPRTESIKMAGGHEDRVKYASLTWSVALETDSLNVLNKFLAEDMTRHRDKQAAVLSSADRIQKGEFDPTTGNISLQSGFETIRETVRGWWSTLLAFLLAAFFWHFAPLALSTLPKTPLWVWFSLGVAAIHRVVVQNSSVDGPSVFSLGCAIDRITHVFVASMFTRLSQEPDAQEILAFVRRSNAMANFAEEKLSWLARLKARLETYATGITWKHAALVVLIGVALHASQIAPLLQSGESLASTSHGEDVSPPAHWSWFSTPKHGMSQTSCSVADPNVVLKKIGDNVFPVVIGDPSGRRKFTNGLVLKSLASGNVWVSTLHSFRLVYPELGKMSVEIPGANNIIGPKGGNIGTTVKLILDPARYVCYPELDLIFFTIQGQHRSDITNYLTTAAHSSSTNGPSYMLSFDESYGGQLQRRTCEGLLFRQSSVPFDDGVKRLMRTFVARWDKSTVAGNCGAPYVQCDGRKTCVVGLHQALKSDGSSHAVHVPTEVVEEAISKLNNYGDSNVVILQGSATLAQIHSEFDRKLAAIDPIRIPGSISIGPLAQRSVFRQDRCREPDISGCLNVVGSLARSSKPPDSKVQVHPLKDALLAATGLPEGPKVPPTAFNNDRFYTAKRHFIKNVCSIPNTLAPKIVNAALTGFIVDAFARLYHPSLKHVRPLTMKESINGVESGPLAKYMSGVVMSTSAGFPYTTVKTSLLVSDEPGSREFKREIYDQADRIRNSLSQGKRPMVSDVMFDAHFKDEPISKSKDEVAKIRVIIASPLALLLVFRQYILPLIAFISANRIAFESCPSTVVQSFEWTLQRYFVTGEDTSQAQPRSYFDGDYKGWDASLQKVLVMCFFRVVYVIAFVSGNYSQDDLNVIVGLSLVICESAVNFFGDIILFVAFNPSGQPGTAHTNGVTNSVIFRIAWILSGHSIAEFRHVVKLLVYGDDNWGSILNTHVSTFNKSVIADTMLPHGIFYTNADKTPEITPTSDLTRIDFLKRTWIWSDSLDAYLAPLHVGTLGGMCCILRTSNSATGFDQIKAGMQSLCDESFFHGEEFFRGICIAVQMTLDETTGNSGSFVPPSYEQKVKNFIADSQFFRENAGRILSSVRK